jgi:signal peptide peptidase SppA
VGNELKYRHIVRAVQETPWAILPGKLATILDLVAFKAQGGNLSAEEVQQRIGAVVRPGSRVAGGVAVLPLYGTVVQRADIFTETSGGTSTERVARQFRELVADTSIGSIVLDVDSPGGAVSGVEELAAEIYKARGTKPIVAVANSLAASAAYWIASAADEVVVTPSGEVGSIGVFMVHEDWSAALEAEGVKPTLVSAGKYKVEANPYEPLGEEAQAALQARVDDYYGMFVAAVARHRGVKAADVRSGFGEGRCVGARQAVALGMADRVGTLDETIERLARGRRKPSGASASAESDDLDLRRRRLRLAEQG